jgi:hypothetical protein
MEIDVRTQLKREKWAPYRITEIEKHFCTDLLLFEALHHATEISVPCFHAH